MFGIGVSELLLIFVVALLVLGPERLPGAARTLAKLFGEFRRATDDLRSSVVGLSDIDQDWRHEHNNPRVLEGSNSEKQKNKEVGNDSPTEDVIPPEAIAPEVIARGSENAHG